MAGGLMGGNGRRGRYRPMAEINVTPMVDVMLVLLIIFMVTAPLLTSGVNVDLPKASASPVDQQDKPLTVSIKADGSIYLQDTPIDANDLVAKLQAIAVGSDGQPDTGRRIFVRADNTISYGKVIQVMGDLTDAGFTKASLLVAQPAGAAAPAATPQAAASP